MEKRVVLAIGLTIVLYAAYFMWFAPRPVPAPAAPPVAPVAQGTVATGSVAHGGPTASPPSPEGPASTVRRPSTQYAAAPADEKLTNATSLLELTSTSLGGSLKAAEVWACANPNHHRGDRSVPGDPGQATGSIEGMPGALSLDLLSAATDVPDLTKSHWKTAREGDALVDEFEVAGLVLSKTTRLSSDPARPYEADVVVTVRNVSAEPGSTKTLEIVGPIPAKPAVNEYDFGALVAQAGEDGAVELFRGPDIQKLLTENPRYEQRPVSGKFGWIGARADFYLGALIPAGDLPPDTSVGFRYGFRPDAKGQPSPVAAATFRIPLVLPPKGGEQKFSFRFVGAPNQRTMLSDESSPYHLLHGATVQRTFLISLTPIARLLAWMLRLIASTGMGYGLAVIALTICVRGALFPLSRKSQISMRLHAQKMGRLKPKLDAIKEKYKDPKKQQEMTMKVMREEKVSLLPGGCLLAFLQMPIWISLYNVLQTTFEMRHAEFLWVKDLTQSDHLAALPFTEGWYVLNGWFNLLPLLMMATWYTSAAMQPLPADPQQASQAKMMRWMPVLMGVFLYSYPAGLTLYMTMSAIWSIGESWLIRKVWLSKMEAALK